ncbi:SRPBCC family protein [Phenylobacterium sp.]|jgi:uncharacterized protein YndB with AHSA1/START domain|uniref:SRPBCC family protein n=1 Tax=Phenylobacterium sp. TaxID=1871053 RepID=UPI002F3FBBAE
MPAVGHDLTLTRIFDAPPEKVWRAWTDPTVLPRWFAPRPWTTSRVEIDVRPGGSSLIVMRDPQGTDYPNPGVYLEVTPNRRLVFTDAYTEAWKPSEKPFFTGIIELEDLGGGKTRYTATARHWTAADKETHEKMGFHEGWGQCADQLAELLPTL